MMSSLNFNSCRHTPANIPLRKDSSAVHAAAVVVGAKNATPVCRTRRTAVLVSRMLSLLVAGLVFFSPPVSAQQKQQVRIVEVIWGFDGRVVTGQFMPLSILVDNLSDQPIEATAQLKRVAGMVNEVGGIAVQSVFLGPNSRRWVQFYPYISDRSATWYFDLRTEDQTYSFDPIDQPRSLLEQNIQDKEPDKTLSAVILDPQGMATRLPTTIKHMPAEIFPPYGTATSGLYALFLDHVPDWETPRQEALLSWLKSGGHLHLLLDSNSQTLRFSGLLAPLNDPFPEFSVASGTVTRHDVQRAGLVSQIVTPAITPPDVTAAQTDEAAELARQAQMTSGFRNFNSYEDAEIFSSLRKITKPEHSWILIFLLSMCYVGLIFPGCWLLSKQRRFHFLVTYGAVAGLAVVFSLIFLIIGRRGYGEATSLHTLAIARAEGDSHWNALQYSTLFVTSGDRYVMEEKDRQTLLASGSAEERVDAVITSGNIASFVARIPPFSSQDVISRRRMMTKSWGLVLTELAQNADELTEMTWTFNENFPTGEETQYFAMHGNKIYTLKADAKKRQLVYAHMLTSLATFCQQQNDENIGVTFTPFGGPQYSQPNKSETPQAECFRISLPRLMSRSLVDDFTIDPGTFRLPQGRIRVMVYAPLPLEWDMPVATEVRRGGRILYVMDMPLQTGPNDF